VRSSSRPAGHPGTVGSGWTESGAQIKRADLRGKISGPRPVRRDRPMMHSGRRWLQTTKTRPSGGESQRRHWPRTGNAHRLAWNTRDRGRIRARPPKAHARVAGRAGVQGITGGPNSDIRAIFETGWLRRSYPGRWSEFQGGEPARRPLDHRCHDPRDQASRPGASAEAGTPPAEPCAAGTTHVQIMIWPPRGSTVVARGIGQDGRDSAPTSCTRDRWACCRQ